MQKKKLRPPVKWHGGKYYLAHLIIKYFPPHHTYLEPFGGAASVLLNKSPSMIEVYNDIDSRITRLFRVLRDHGKELQKRLTLTPYSEIEFYESTESAKDEIEQARRDFIRWRLSLGGRGDSFSFTLHRARKGMADVVSGYLSIIDEQLPMIVERLRSVEILNRPAEKVIQKWDSPETLIYCDPPYVSSTRQQNSRNIYNQEMTDEDHRNLAAILTTCKSMVVISGYPSKLYDELYSTWNRVEFNIANHASGSKKKNRKKECLWMNFT